MPTPRNRFRAMLAEGTPSVGLWMAMRDPYTAEAVARTGFDWLMIDAEHAPNDLATVTAQLPVIEPHAAPILRLPMNEPWLIKQALDAGVQTLLAPMVNSADEARAVARAMRYPPDGIRGVGHVLGRASRFGAVADYRMTANDEMCLIVQIETRAALDALEEIVAVKGVDAAFVGPADLAADLGLPFDGPEVRGIVADTLGRIAKAGKPAGIIDFGDEAIARHFDAGARFVAVGADIVVLSQTLRGMASAWKARLGRDPGAD